MAQDDRNSISKIFDCKIKVCIQGYSILSEPMVNLEVGGMNLQGFNI